MTPHKYSMKTYLFIGMLLLVCSGSQAKDPSIEILGKWRPAEKDSLFTWELQKDGTLIIKGDNGKVMALQWRIIPPDLLELKGFPVDGPPEKFRLEDNKLILIDNIKGEERVSIRVKE